ncbi:type VII secretion integral membrane protein EccD [Phycicoccus sonneratiae]|uniref:Type VII secretion integral membrane protein EccD n=1 Tax=Phycicoccus sonneratiae TaxID=2807628 RepID=A0ABS2CGR1_9MICO|nr:type VII secretion integral membrane protein EccD [Phycicoccus sonneraticus]MBM6399053.1 type VII secretion integral membrane protein EccD [Phycicoccus sonneraticus]
MSQTSAAASLVRVSVSSGTRRADLGVPGGIPVVEIVPELARELGVLDTEQASHGYRLVAGGGVLVDPDRSLAAQGITDGTVLSLEVVDPSTEKVYDDVVEAVADVVETQFAPWTARHSAGTAVGAATVFFLCAAWALFTARDSGALVAAVSLAVALLLVGAAAVLHTRAQTGGALALGLTSLAYAATAGSALVPGDPLWGRGLLWVGACVAVLGLIAALAVGRHRLVLAAGAVVGIAVTGVGVAAGVFGASMTSTCAVTFVLAVVLGNVLPWLGLSSSRLSTHAPRTEAEIEAEVPEVDRERVRSLVGRGHDVMVSVALASGGVMLVVVPQLAASGLPGTLLVVVGSVAVLLRTRHSRTRTSVVLAMATGVLGLALAAVVAALAHPSWRPALAVVLGAAGAVVVTLAVLAPRTRVRLGRIADALDGLVLVALLPLGAATVGIL